jgi:YYY domain-containing protein
MILDWLSREGMAVLSWWAISTLFGIAVFPLLFRFMRAMPSRGYPLARTAGLMLTGFVFWFGNVLQLFKNTPGSTLFAALIVLTAGIVALLTWQSRRTDGTPDADKNSDKSITQWVRGNLSLIITTEALFAVAFLAWALFRAMNPDLRGTEHPMDMAFFTASRRSEVFPPADPWMSGYAISYYHFGYVLMGMIANLSGVNNGIGYNLSVAMIFALGAVSAFGVAYDLVMSRGLDRGVRRWHATATGLVAASFLVLMGNLGTSLIEMPYHAKLTDNNYLTFWDIRHRDPLDPGCTQSGSADPTTWQCGWWWWAYSRVVRDYDLAGRDMGDVITETPQFSFTLADLHPHMMAIPFAVLVLGLGFNLVAGQSRPAPWEFLLYAIFTGGMAFLNSWDAVYIVFIIGAEVLRRLMRNGTGGLTREDWIGAAVFGVGIFALTGLLYAPFFISFRSQAGGFIPNLIWTTRPQQLFLMFGTFLVIIGMYLTLEVRRAGNRFNGGIVLQSLLFGVAMIVVLLIGLAIIAWSSPTLRQTVFRVVDESGGIAGVLPTVAIRRLQGVPTLAILITMMLIVVGRLFAREPRSMDGAPERADRIITYSPATGYALLMIAAGAALVMLPEFFILRDGFGYRINMIFKLWYQGWTIWSIAGAFALWSVVSEGIIVLEKRKKSAASVGDDGEGITEEVQTERPFALRPVFGTIAAVMILLGMTFPYATISTRSFADGGVLRGTAELSLDGAPSLAAGDADHAAIQCLKDIATDPDDVVVEATIPGLAYNSRGIFSRVSGLTGIPTILGWDNHQRQWRGETFEDALNISLPTGGTETRYDAVANLYNSTDWSVVRDVVNRYGITYIYVGPTERRFFDAVGLAKFAELQPVCEFGDAAVYPANAVPGLRSSGG